MEHFLEGIGILLPQIKRVATQIFTVTTYQYHSLNKATSVKGMFDYLGNCKMQKPVFMAKDLPSMYQVLNNWAQICTLLADFRAL